MSYEWDVATFRGSARNSHKSVHVPYTLNHRHSAERNHTKMNFCMGSKNCQQFCGARCCDLGVRPILTSHGYTDTDTDIAILKYRYRYRRRYLKYRNIEIPGKIPKYRYFRYFGSQVYENNKSVDCLKTQHSHITFSELFALCISRLNSISQ